MTASIVTEVISLLQVLNTLTPLAIIALLALAIFGVVAAALFHIVKGRQQVSQIANNHLHELPTMVSLLQNISHSSERQEKSLERQEGSLVEIRDDINFLKGRLG